MSKSALNKLDEIRAMVGDTAVDIAQASKSAAIRILVTPLNRFDSFEAQLEKVTIALEAATKLLQIGKNLQKGIEENRVREV